MFSLLTNEGKTQTLFSCLFSSTQFPFTFLSAVTAMFRLRLLQQNPSEDGQVL